jgi:hypothetical protein
MQRMILGLALIASVAPVMAQTPPPPPPGGPMRGPGAAMMSADTDHDGSVTRTEAMAQAAERFDRMDANRDGRIDRAEIAQVRDAWRDRRGPRGETPPPPPRP